MEKDTVFSSGMPKVCICLSAFAAMVVVAVLVASFHSTSAPSCSNRKRIGTIVLSFTNRAGTFIMLFPLFIYDCIERTRFVHVKNI